MKKNAGGLRNKVLSWISKTLDNSKWFQVPTNPDTTLNKYPAKNREFYEKNRIEVLALYRHLLTNIPNKECNYIRKRYLKEEIRFVFREHSKEDDIESILKMKNDAYIIIEKINSGVYPPFPQYEVL